MIRLITLSILLSGTFTWACAQELQRESPPPYRELPLELQSYDITGKRKDIENLNSYILWEKGGADYVLPEKNNHQTLYRFLEKQEVAGRQHNRIPSFDQWIEEYDGTFLTAPSFDFTDAWEYRFTSPLNALRSYWHALNRCDAELILGYADPSFVNDLERHLKWSLLASPPTFNHEGRTRVIPLLQGVCVTGGKEYTMLFYRRESPSDPASGRVSFHWDFFVLLNGTYYLSDAPATSRFGNMAEAMHLGYVYPAGKYEYLAEKLQATSMPQAFYEIQD